MPICGGYINTAGPLSDRVILTRLRDINNGGDGRRGADRDADHGADRDV